MTSRTWLLPGSLLLLFLAVALPATLTSRISTFDDGDERVFHLPAIEKFAQEVSTRTLIETSSATTPLYHLTMAVALRMGAGTDVEFLRLFTSMAAAMGLVAAWLFLNHLAGPAVASLSAACMAFSPYYLGTAVRLSTDAMAWAFVWSTIALLAPPPASAATEACLRRRMVLATGTILGAVLTRQIHLWLVAILVTAPLVWREQPSRRSLAWGFTLAAIPLAAVAAFAWLWGGLTPPRFQAVHQTGFNPVPPIYICSMFGLYSVFFAPWWWESWRQPRAWLTRWPPILAAVLAFALLMVVPMNTDHAAGRWGGALWSAASRLPTIGRSSVLFAVLFPLGAAMATHAALSLHTRMDAFIGMVAMTWIAAHCGNATNFQKYFEPMTLLLTAAVASRLTPHVRPWALCGPALLTFLMLTVSIVRLFGSQVALAIP